MTEQEVPYGATVRVEILVELINQARGIVTARVHEIKATDYTERRQMLS
ncbi:hypothetical protein [Shinella sp.]|jgi:hypothetical protein